VAKNFNNQFGTSHASRQNIEKSFSLLPNIKFLIKSNFFHSLLALNVFYDFWQFLKIYDIFQNWFYFHKRKSC